RRSTTWLVTIYFPSRRQYRTSFSTLDYSVNFSSTRPIRCDLVYCYRWTRCMFPIIHCQMVSNAITRNGSSKQGLGNSQRDSRMSTAIKWAIIILVFLVFARSWYISAISNFYAFYVMDTYHLSIAQAQIYIFIF